MAFQWESRTGFDLAGWSGFEASIEKRTDPLGLPQYRCRVVCLRTDETVFNSVGMGLEPRSIAAARKLCEVFAWHAATYGEEPAPRTQRTTAPEQPGQEQAQPDQGASPSPQGFLVQLDAAAPNVGDRVALADIFRPWERKLAKAAAIQSGRYEISTAHIGRTSGRPPLVATRTK